MRPIQVGLAAVSAAAVMYVMDPDQGHARRAFLRDRVLHLARMTSRHARNSGLDVSNRARGVVARMAARVSTGQPPDSVLAAHVRSEMGHVVRHPHQVSVVAEAGWIELRGHVLPDEHRALLGAIRRIPGVFGIADNLDEHGWVDAQAAATGG